MQRDLDHCLGKADAIACRPAKNVKHLYNDHSAISPEAAAYGCLREGVSFI